MGRLRNHEVFSGPGRICGDQAVFQQQFAIACPTVRHAVRFQRQQPAVATRSPMTNGERAMIRGAGAVSGGDLLGLFDQNFGLSDRGIVDQTPIQGYRALSGGFRFCHGGEDAVGLFHFGF